MDPLNRLLQKQLSKPRTYSQLKNNPFPYLNECNRLEIFEFIHELQRQNRRLRDQIAAKYPKKQFAEIMQENSRLKLRGKIIEMNRQSVEKMEQQMKGKMWESDGLKTKNNELQLQCGSLQKQISVVETRMMEVQREKRQKEFQLKSHQQRVSQVDESLLFKNLYGEVKSILQKSL